MDVSLMITTGGTGLLNKAVSVEGATDKQILRLLGESACPCLFLTI